MPDQYLVPKLNPEMFRAYNPRANLTLARIQETAALPIIEEVYKGKDKGLEGGIYRKLKGIPFDNKCFPDADILNCLNVVKADLVTYFLPFSTKATFLPLVSFLCMPKKWKLQTIERFLEHYFVKANRILLLQLEDCSYSCFFEDPSLYCDFARELSKFVTVFVSNLGINKSLAERLGELFALFVEYDDAYRLRMQDIFSETTAEKLTSRKELKRLALLYGKREQIGALTDKMQALVNILSFGLWLPGVKRALKTALQSIDFSKFQLDQADRYFCLTWSNYDFFGQSTEQRKETYLEIHKDGLAPMVKTS